MKWIKHIVVWLVFFAAFVALTLPRLGWEHALWRSFTLICTQALVFYLNFYVLIPRLLEKRRYIGFGLTVLVLTVVAVWLGDVLESLDGGFKEVHEKMIRQNHAGKPIPKERIGHIRRAAHHGKIIINVIITLGTLFISTIVWSVSARTKREQEKIQGEKRMLEAESKFLRSQINPHFLFNTLNNIYALSQLHADKAPEYIHKFSELLRYVLYEAEPDKVPLVEEVKYIHSYVDLQKLKQSDMSNVKLDLDRIDGSLQIAPLLLIPFVENSFKHSHIEDTEVGWIKSELTTDQGVLHFHISNSKPARATAKDKVGGIGLENIKRRLELAYPDRHDLNISETDDQFEVQLSINLSE